MEQHFQCRITTNNTCTVRVPDEFRQRYNATDPKPRGLWGQLRLLTQKENGRIAAHFPIELTTHILRKGGEQQREGRILWNSTMSNTTSIVISYDHWVPMFKYAKAPLRVRLVAEDRKYGTHLQRKDGLRLMPWNQTHYRPTFYVDDNALARSNWVELGPPPRPSVNVTVKFSTISPILDAFNHLVVSQGLQMMEPMLDDEMMDEIRYFLADERLYRFACSQLISMIHVWLEYQAFCTEVRFYRGRDLAGVSLSSISSQFASSFIILLYLLDVGQTSWVVLLSVASSTLVEGWKLLKILRPSRKPEFPFVTWNNRLLETTMEQNAASYDRIAMRYLAYMLYPIVSIWSIYSLVNFKYQSWWSWLISNLANMVYTFGFISLCPQVYVNYRLKSVAHLPWKVFLYKLFTTFVDDAFAWLVDMPLKHKLMTLRDDVVWVVLLYQAFVYRIDKTRTNEYGYSYENEPDTIKTSTDEAAKAKLD